MKSTEVYRILRESLGSFPKARGFKRAGPGYFGYVRRVDSIYEKFGFQCDKWGWDAHGGSGFFVNFECGPSEELWSGRLARLNTFLSDVELEEVRLRQNQIKAGLTMPPYLKALIESDPDMNPDIRRAYMDDYLQHEKGYYVRNIDFTLRYFSSEDIRWWARFVEPRIEACLLRLRTSEEGLPLTH